MNRLASEGHAVAIESSVELRGMRPIAAIAFALGRWLHRIAATLGVLVRAAALLFALRCVLWRWEAVGDATSAAIIGAAAATTGLLLFGRPMIRLALSRRRARASIPERAAGCPRAVMRAAASLLGSSLLWILTLAVTVACVAFGLGPLEDDGAGPAPALLPFWTPQMDNNRRVYDGGMTSDGRYLFATQARCENPGIMRFDLERDQWQTIAHGRDMSVFATLLEDKNQGLVVDSSAGLFDQAAETLVQWFRLDPFELIAVQRLPFGKVSSAIQVDGQTLAFLSAWGSLILSPARPDVGDTEYTAVGLYQPAGTPPRPVNGTTRPLEDVLGRASFEYLNLESSVREPDTRYTWLSAEMGRTIARFDLATRTLDRAFSVGPFTWQTAYDAKRRRVYVTRTLQRRVDAFDAETGTLVTSYQLRGVPRPVLLDPDGNHLYVGLYWSRLIATIDLNTGRVIGHIKTGSRLRRLIWRSSGGLDEVIALSEDGLYRIPASRLREPTSVQVLDAPLSERVHAALGPAGAG